MKNIFYLLTSITFFSIESAPGQNFDWADVMLGYQTFGRAIISDSQDNIYITGDFQDTVDFDPGPGVYNVVASTESDFFIEKIDAGGSFVWVKTLDSYLYDSGASLAVDQSDNVYVAGSTGGIINQNILIRKYNSSGTLIWSKGIGSNSYDVATDIKIDNAGHLYVTGIFDGTPFAVDFDPGIDVHQVSGEGFFLLKMDTAGYFISVVTLDGTGLTGSGSALCIDEADNIYVTGNFNGAIDFDPGPDTVTVTASDNENAFILKLDSSGEFIWVKTFDASANSVRVFDMILNSHADIYLFGTYWDTLDSDPGPASNYFYSEGSSDMFIIKLDSSGTYDWSGSMGGTGSDEAQSISIDTFGNVYTTGYFTDTIDFDPGPAVRNLIAKGGMDGFVQQFSPNGDLGFVLQFSGTSWVRNGAIHVDENNNIFIAGQCNDSTDFDPGSGQYIIPGQGAFLLKLSQPFLFRNDELISCLQIYPNPVSKHLSIMSKQYSIDKIEIYNVVGEKMNPKIFSPDSEKLLIDVTNLNDGIYFLKAETENGIAVQKFIKQ